MNEYVIVTINPGYTGSDYHKVVLASRPRIEKCDGKEYIKVEGMIIDSCYSFEEAEKAVRDRDMY